MRVSATRSVASLRSKSLVSRISSAALAHAGCAPSITLSTTDRAVMRASDFGIRSDLRGSPAVVAERFVAVFDRIPETVLDRIGDEGVALRGVAGDAVEDRADHPTGGH